MLISILMLVVGFVILIKGADIFVDGAKSLARNFKVSAMLIGLTIVAFGTGTPELAISIQSLINGNGDIVLGNVIGSNILNILLTLGISSTIHYLAVKNNTVKKELPITLLITTLLIILMSDNIFDSNMINSFTREDGIVVLLFFMVFIYYLMSMIRNKVDDGSQENPKYNIKKSILYTLIGVICIVLGSNFVVKYASNIATILGVSERMISLTIVSLGTSLPELVTSIVATKKGEYDIAIGNVVGSNIFNIGIVLGLPVAIFGGISKISFNYIDLFVLFISSLLLFVLSYNDRKITKKEGIVMLMLFVIYYSYVIFI